jgi:recombinational DNA repair protein (RecF pathway)
MTHERAEGILLKSTPYLGHQKILQVLFSTGELGGLITKNKALSPLTTPFLKAEWIYQRKNSLFLVVDGTVLDDFAFLKRNYSAIQAAGKMAQAILFSQMPGKPGGGALYALTLAFLRQLEVGDDFTALLWSFQLKLLLSEGVLALEENAQDSGLEGATFENFEWETVRTLTYSRSFQEIRSISLTPTLEQKLRTAIRTERDSNP